MLYYMCIPYADRMTPVLGINWSLYDMVIPQSASPTSRRSAQQPRHVLFHTIGSVLSQRCVRLTRSKHAVCCIYMLPRRCAYIPLTPYILYYIMLKKTTIQPACTQRECADEALAHPSQDCDTDLRSGFAIPGNLPFPTHSVHTMKLTTEN